MRREPEDRSDVLAERPLRVAFDVTPELVGATGVARYSRELGRALDRRADCELRRIAIGRRTEALPPQTSHLRVPLRVAQAAWRAFGIPRAESLVGAVDLVHSLDLMAPPTRLPLVVTVHDVVALELSHFHPRRAVELQRRRLASLSRASVVVCDSQSTADELVARGVEPARISVVYLGLTRLPTPVDPPLPPEPFVLAVGTLEPRKGHDLLLRAFAATGIHRHRLVFAGPPVGRSQGLAELASELGIGERLTILGVVDDAVLAGLYRDASALCMPSLAEGFGLPVLEAMSFGVPVVASDLAVLREVTGDSAVLVAPGSADALARALERVLTEDALAARLRSEGRARAARFTWEATARKTVAAYRRAVHECRAAG